MAPSLRNIRPGLTHCDPLCVFSLKALAMLLFCLVSGRYPGAARSNRGTCSISAYPKTSQTWHDSKPPWQHEKDWKQIEQVEKIGKERFASSIRMNLLVSLEIDAAKDKFPPWLELFSAELQAEKHRKAIWIHMAHMNQHESAYGSIWRLKIYEEYLFNAFSDEQNSPILCQSKQVHHRGPWGHQGWLCAFSFGHVWTTRSALYKWGTWKS